MAEVIRYTRAEISKQDGKDNRKLWIIVKDIVYDVTTYLHEHPDGEASILEVGGKDATKDFADHSSDAKKILAKYKIGEIVEEEKYYDANGKKKKGVVSTDAEQGGRGCMSIITCGLLG
ncbi:cytochrome b5-like [Hyposmocoma kahamanoa]|uniref:cytochrome b5-like n=1 Tax=Hyposmocoma kahamanoa TaxID=1477025 RepID=UPI000E6D7DAC|nr:cytochrome b5-like [Hyposmocoma kahamanoa]